MSQYPNSNGVSGRAGSGAAPNRPSLNVHLTVPQTQAAGGGADGSHTPNTPEILNSIVNMTHGPFTGFVAQQQQQEEQEQQQQQQHLATPSLSVGQAEVEAKFVFNYSGYSVLSAYIVLNQHSTYVSTFSAF